MTIVSSFGRALYQLGVVKFYSADLSGAEGAFQNAVRLEPRWAISYTRLGDVYRESSKYKEAIDAYRKAADMDRTSAAAQAGLGLARALKGEKDGVKDMERAIQMDTASGIANFNLGVFFSTSKKSGELDRAIKELNTAIQKNPGNLEFQNSKAEQLIAEIQKKRKK
jgi:tetratricopeptide (TPR) repeat protein